MLRVLAKLVGVIAAVVAGLLISLALVHAVKFGFIPSVLTFSMFGRLYGYVESYGSTKFFVHDHRIVTIGFPAAYLWFSLFAIALFVGAFTYYSMKAFQTDCARHEPTKPVEPTE